MTQKFRDRSASLAHMLAYHAVTACARMQLLNETHSALRFISMQTLAGRPSEQSVLKKRTPRRRLCAKFSKCWVCEDEVQESSPYTSKVNRTSQLAATLSFQLPFSTWSIDTINCWVSGESLVSYSPCIMLLSGLLHVTREFLSVACQENEGVLPVRILGIIRTR